MGRRRWALIACVGLVAATSLVGNRALAAGTGAAPPRLVTLTIPAPAGEIPSQWLNYPGPPRANVLLPPGYDPRRHYPLLVLLHGLTCNYDWYVQSGLIKAVTGIDAIVVMPEAGSGWYTDWWNNGERNGPGWETYLLDTVLPTIEARYPILPQRQYHALAGISMGGLGAAYLGGRLPGFFGSVATLSGFDDPGLLAPVVEPAMGITADAAPKGDHDPDPVDGPPAGFYFQGHDPALLAANLGLTRVFQSTSTGIPSSGDVALTLGGDAAGVAADALTEGLIIYPMNQLYHAALTAAHVDVTYQVHPGGHDLPDFSNELKAMLAWGLFKPVVTDPRAWVNDTVATSGQLWDIAYRFAQPPDRVVRFQRIGSTLTIGAAGSAVTIITRDGCTVHAATPATLQLSSRSCR